MKTRFYVRFDGNEYKVCREYDDELFAVAYNNIIADHIAKKLQEKYSH